MKQIIKKPVISMLTLITALALILATYNLALAVNKNFKTDMQLIQDFLSQTDENGTNAEKLGWDIDNIGTWKGAEFVDFEKEKEKEKVIKSLNISGKGKDLSKKLHGKLDLRSCFALEELIMDDNVIEELDIRGCRSLETLIINNNSLDKLSESDFPDIDRSNLNIMVL